MQITFNSIKGRRGGYALVMTMVFLAVMLVVFASMMSWVSSQTRVSQRNNQYVMSEAAAEAAIERVEAPMMRDFLTATLTNASYYAGLQVVQTNADGVSPWPVQYTFSDISNHPGQITVLAGVSQGVLQPIGSQFANLQGYPCYYTNIATATPIGQPYTVPATLTEVINFSTIPIFQYAIFYNLNLEMDPGAPMFVNGPVWSNQGLWGGTANLTFNSTVSAVSNACITSTDPFANGKTDASAPPNFRLSGQPSSGNSSLVMPIAGATNSNPTNVEAVLNIPPYPYNVGTLNGFSTNGQEYLANLADLIISNSPNGINSATPTGTNLTVYYLDQLNTPFLVPVANDFYRFNPGHPPATGLITNWVSPYTADTNRCYTNVAYAGWTWLTNVAFYDYRESDTVQAVQIDVGLMKIWMTNHIMHGGVDYGGYYYNSNLCITDKFRSIGGLWVYNGVPISSSTLPAVRLADGIQLPSAAGLTVVTPMPVYVVGDYNKQWDSSHVSNGTNTLYTYPAALMGDAVTILSGAWSDAYTSGTALSSRSAQTTVVNAACLEGIVQSNPKISGNYSGGVENFLRFLETWGGSTSTYNGSIVVMFPSVYSTNSWSYGSYYTAPTRAWGFDYNFTQASKLPLMTPQLKKTVRISWSP